MERVSRKDDERLYQPQIRGDRIKALYQLKLLTGLPLTVLVDMAIARLLDDHSRVGEVKIEYGQGNDQ